VLFIIWAGPYVQGEDRFELATEERAHLVDILMPEPRRRAGVTIAIQRLEERKLIRAARGD
jgi:hypothetical protein